MVAWVGSPGVSVSVSMGSPVGWVPLAPREPYYPAYRYTPRYLEHVNSPYGRVPPVQPPREVRLQRPATHAGRRRNEL